MNTIAARTLDLGPVTARRGDRVDTSKWDVSAVVASLRMGDLYVRDGARVYAPRIASFACAVCGLPFAGHSDLDAHGRAAHGFQGGGGTDPAPAWVEIEVTLSNDEHKAALAGGLCPLCGRPASAAHLAEMHPEARTPTGLAYRADTRPAKAAA